MKHSKSGTTLVERRRPTQERAVRSVDAILDAAARLLDEVGLEGFNTNVLAERAGVRVRTVYRYFPNKYAVLVALTTRLAVHWDEWMSECYTRLADPAQDWRTALRECRMHWTTNARRLPGAISVLQAINATPELAEVHMGISAQMTQKLAAALTSRGVRLPRARLLAVARLLISAQNAGTELYLRHKGADARLILQEMNVAETAYLAHYLDRGNGP